MNSEDKIRLFGFSHSALERELDRVEESLKIDLGRPEENERDEDYYPQFDQALRKEAAVMGEHYELFYCLEKAFGNSSPRLLKPSTEKRGGILKFLTRSGRTPRLTYNERSIPELRSDLKRRSISRLSVSLVRWSGIAGRVSIRSSQAKRPSRRS